MTIENKTKEKRKGIPKSIEIYERLINDGYSREFAEGITCFYEGSFKVYTDRFLREVRKEESS